MKNSNHSPMFKLYRFFLNFYPKSHRKEYGEAMEQLFRDLYRDSQNETSLKRIQLFIRIFGDTFISILRENIVAFSAKESASANLFSQGLDAGSFIFRPTKPKVIISTALLLLFVLVSFGGMALFSEPRYAGTPMPHTRTLVESIINALSYPVFLLSGGMLIFSTVLCPELSQCDSAVSQLPDWAMSVLFLMFNALFIYALVSLILSLRAFFEKLLTSKGTELKRVLVSTLVVALIGIGVYAFFSHKRQAALTQRLVSFYENDKNISEYLEKNVASTVFNGKAFCAYDTLTQYQVGEDVQHYMWAGCYEYYLDNGQLKKGTQVIVPVALYGKASRQPCESMYSSIGGQIPCTKEYNSDALSYTITSYKAPRDGNLFTKDVKEIFPRETWNYIFNYKVEDDGILDHKAKVYFKLASESDYLPNQMPNVRPIQLSPKTN